VARLKVSAWFSRADWWTAAEVASHSIACGAWKAQVFSSSWTNMVSGGRRLVEEKGLSIHLSTILPGKRRVSEELGEVLKS
jgi:hypothetical protein